MNRSAKWLLVMALAATVAVTGCGKKQAAEEPGKDAKSEVATSSNLPKGVVARVGNEDVKEEAFNSRLRVFELYYNQDLLNNGEAKNQLLERYVEEAMMLKEAKAKNLTADEAVVKADIENFEAALAEKYGGKEGVEKAKQQRGVTNELLTETFTTFQLAQKLADEVVKDVKATDAEIQAYYDKNKDTLFTAPEEQVRASHILVADEAKAKELLAKIRAGEDFATLAKENSTDTVSAQQGGDLEYFGKGRMVAEFDEAVWKLKVGEVSEPVKTQFGYHIIKMTDKIPAGPIPLTGIRNKVAEAAVSEKKQESFDKFLADLTAKYKPEKVAFPETAPAGQ